MIRRGVFLDLDGTLADSLGAMRDAYERFIGEFGLAGSDAEFRLINGPPLREIVAMLQARHGIHGDLDTLYRRYEAQVDRVFGDAPPMRGAEMVLRTASEHGWITGVVTSNTAPRTKRWLERRGFSSLVDLVVGGEEVAHGKPAPDPYLKALALSGAAAPLSLAAEDTPQGARAALGAGLATYAISGDAALRLDWPPRIRPIAALDELVPVLAVPATVRRAAP